MKAILFDFDGLILDTEMPIFQAWQETYDQFGCSLTVQEYSSCLGSSFQAFSPYEDLERKSARSIDWEEVRPRIVQRYTDLIARRDALPGIRECLSEAKARGMRIGLASSSTREWVTGHLTRLDLFSGFDVIRTRDDVKNLKPEPDLFLAGLEALGSAAEETFVLEDSPNGILAAKRAGLFVVAVTSQLTRQLPLNGPDLCLETLGEVSLQQLLAMIDEQKRCCL